MRRMTTLALGLGMFLGAAASPVRADWVELANNDLVQGEIESLDGEKLKLKSANFGEMTIPRDKVRLIGLGDRPLPAAPQPAAPAAEHVGTQLPSLENAQFNQLLQQVLGGGGMPDLQQNLNKAKKDLKQLRRDLGSTPEAEALDSYLQIFELLGNLAPRGNPSEPKTAPTPPPAKPQPPSPPSAKAPPQPKADQ